ncbi:MAG: lysine-2,3-aminomutase-like protein [Proteobacteria bacterium]|nr:lysine-2,3-aminomutase-like protein [Pseudomonadota bacterium]MBS0573637.1 lysine-2,3-aminomutase-like protein [Pseudomonadota bacterium]
MPSSPASARRARALTGVGDFVREGLVNPADRAGAAEVAAAFRLRLSPEMHAAIGAGDPGGDPVARQFVPSAEELTIDPAELADPIGDLAHSPVRGLTHRYPDRVILHLTQTCDVYCRFCFRREAVGETGALAPEALAAAIAHIRAHPAITEVILTGGDPLTLSPRRLAEAMRMLAAIPHVAVVRIHSRVPVVAPGRVTPELLAALDAGPAVFVVVHTNHAQELTGLAQAALARLVRAGIPLLSQSVLLRGVNDSAEALAGLFRALLRNRVKPYYLHHCDLARGTGHFRTTIAEGLALMAGLRGHLSGTALPTYVLDIPGGHGKVPLASPWLAPGPGPGQWRVTDWQGRVHDYRDPERASGAINSTSIPSRMPV